MQANKLDAALGEMTTAKQMGPHLVAADFNLGILYKRELRNPDAEAALKQVIAVDSQDPSAWFNLGTVYFAEKTGRLP
jgi:Flp pilus assembly protein TadD